MDERCEISSKNKDIVAGVKYARKIGFIFLCTINNSKVLDYFYCCSKRLSIK
jgi:hypothetical protein